MKFSELLQINLKRLRKELGMTQADLSEKMKVNRVTVGYWETGATTPGPDTFDALAECLGVEVWQLFAPAATNPRSKEIQDCFLTVMEYTKNKLLEDLQKAHAPAATIDHFNESLSKKVTPPLQRRHEG